QETPDLQLCLPRSNARRSALQSTENCDQFCSNVLEQSLSREPDWPNMSSRVRAGFGAQNEDRPSVVAMLAAGLDRALPVPLGIQLSGLIQYGIALGDLTAGTRLPPVRDLAERAGIAPMTVVGVYN